jgi:UrcA family protein
MRKANFTALLAVLAAGVTQVALADTTDDVTLSRHVNYSDLDVAHDAGVKQLYDRLTRAANSVCGPYDSAEMKKAGVYANCVQHSLARAVAKVNNPMLTSYYESKTATPPAQLARLDR